MHRATCCDEEDSCALLLVVPIPPRLIDEDSLGIHVHCALTNLLDECGVLTYN